MSKLCRFMFVSILFVLVQSILLASFGIWYTERSDKMAPSRGMNVRNTQITNVMDHNDSSRSGSKADVKVILVTQARSGSTFTGDMFNHHSQVFYFYEPLWTIKFYFQRLQAQDSFRMHPALFFHEPMVFKTLTTADQQISSLKQNVIEAIIKCDFEPMYLGPLLSPVNYNFSHTCKPFGECAARNPGVLGLRRCLPELDKVCRSASVIAMKVLQLRVEEVETFLKADPKVKVVHLVRDPRGVLSSRKKTGLDETYQRTDTIFCDRLTKDVHDSMALMKKYLGRVMRARYEDLAQWPQDFATQLLNFAGLSMEPELRKYIRSITSTKKYTEKEDKWSTFRADSKRTAGMWRASASIEFVSSIDRNCRMLYELMGYVPFANETALRNMDVPFFKDYREVPGLWNTTMQ